MTQIEVSLSGTVVSLNRYSDVDIEKVHVSRYLFH